MYRFVVALTFCIFIYVVYGYSTGAPEEVCNTMTPKHPFTPQTNAFPYFVSLSKTAVAPGQKVLIKISGGKEDPTFAGFLVQVRKENKAIGSFDVSNTEGMAKTITCHQAVDSAATHNSSDPKEQIEFNWIAPKTLKGKLNVYVTVAKDGATYWAHQKKNEISVL